MRYDAHAYNQSDLVGQKKIIVEERAKVRTYYTFRGCACRSGT